MSVRRRESAEAAHLRWEQLHLLQEHYREFATFLQDVMELLGFRTTAIQLSIALFIAHGPQYIMVQAQRGQAKTTIAAAYAVWCLIHSPAHRVLIISAAGPQASDIATLIVRIIETMDVLDCMRPDQRAGDRTSATEGYDIHHSLKGIDKSASITCRGIDANLQGLRADLLIPDDVESSKNSRTAANRALLAHLVTDFTSICSTGRVVWLGTPQSQDSIYNVLPARGVTLRIWPGRYPTVEQREKYGSFLAPEIDEALRKDPSLQTGGGLLGNQGQPIDPDILDEMTLQAKELQQGEAWFQLQHMLNTSVTDAMRYPLKPEQLVVLQNIGDRVPTNIVRGFDKANLVPFASADFAFHMMRPHSVSHETSVLKKKVMYIDPAPGGINGDETGYAIGSVVSSMVVLKAVGGLPGGYDIQKMEHLRDLAVLHSVDVVVIERNLGFGAFRVVFAPVLAAKHPSCQLLDDYVTGQKETRLIETLAPVLGRGALVIDQAVVAEDHASVQRYEPAKRQSYSFFYQLAKLTRVRGALTHDDRLDAVEGLVRHFQPALTIDQTKALAAQQAEDYRRLTTDPLGHKRFNGGPAAASNILTTRLGRRR